MHKATSTRVGIGTRSWAALAAGVAALAATGAQAVAAPGGSTVSGTVALGDESKRGEPPELNRGFVPRMKNQLRGAKAFNPLPYVVVVLEGGSVAAEDKEPPSKPVTYKIVGESFEVPLMPVVVGSKVQIKNAGPNKPRLYAPSMPDLVPEDPINPKGVRPSSAISEPHKLIELRDHDSAHLRGHLVAFDHAYFALADAESGAFSIEGVPEGTWQVRLWYRDGWVELGDKVTVDVPARKAPKPITVNLPLNLKTTPPAGG